MTGVHVPCSISQLTLGPIVPIGMHRKYLPYSCGLAPSYIPKRLFIDAVANAPNLLSLPVEQLVQKPLATSTLLAELGDDLQNHLENRIQLFLQQMILVYKTNLSISAEKHGPLGP